MRKIMNLGLLAGLVSLLFAATPALAQPPAAQVRPAAASMGNEQTCLKCHGKEPGVIGILKTPHAVKGDPHTPFGVQGCQACHGQSQKHLASRDNPPTVVFKGPNASPVAVRNAQCLSCHENGLRMNWKGSPHQTNEVACVSCHRIHKAKDPVLVKSTQPKICFTCHKDIRADTYKYSHHPIREGKVVCSDCHNPHGAMGDTKLLKEFTVNQTCYNCHADKRGPLLWEHQPVRENCLNCHNPHGSNQPRLLIEPMNFLCASCHSAQSNRSGGAFGGAHSIPSGPLGSHFFNSALANQRTCVNCHSQVHGSNSPNGAFFLR